MEEMIDEKKQDAKIDAAFFRALVDNFENDEETMSLKSGEKKDLEEIMKKVEIKLDLLGQEEREVVEKYILRAKIYLLS